MTDPVVIPVPDGHLLVRIIGTGKVILPRENQVYPDALDGYRIIATGVYDAWRADPGAATMAELLAGTPVTG